MTPIDRRQAAPKPRIAALLLALAVAGPAAGQLPAPQDAPAEPPPPAQQGAAAGPAESPLAPLAWLYGCWRGNVNQREFREQWMPLRGGMMVGMSHTVIGPRTQGFEFLRLEARADGVWYVASPPGKEETAFKLTGEEKDQDDVVFTFSRPGSEFPQRILYRRATRGWLYAHVEGTLRSGERKVIYPMRRIDCETGEQLDR